MSNFEQALILSVDGWSQQFEENLTEYEHSERYEKNIAKLLDRMRNNKLHRFTAKTVRAIIIAAVILALATTVVARKTILDFFVEHYGGYDFYEVSRYSDITPIDFLKIGYIPDGFVMTDKDESEAAFIRFYENGELHFVVSKSLISSGGTHDNETNQAEKIIINGMEYIYYYDEEYHNIDFIWNNGDYIYQVNSNLSYDETLKIVENIE